MTLGDDLLIESMNATCFPCSCVEGALRMQEMLARIEELEADMDRITGALAGVGTLYTEETALARINLMPSVQAAWDRNLGDAS